jgi:hypothetical protein
MGSVVTNRFLYKRREFMSLLGGASHQRPGGRAEAKRRHSQLDVCNCRGKLLFGGAFVVADVTIDHLAPETKRLVERLCRGLRELSEATFEARLTVLKLRALRARANGQPYLAA